MTQNNFYKEYKTVDGQEYKIVGNYDIGDHLRKRGYFLSVSKIKTEEKDGYTTEIFEYHPGGGKTHVKELLLEVKRKSQKAEDKAFDMIREERVNELIEYLNK